MYRTRLTDLKDWYNSSHRKPLVIRGARQVGKTWLVKELASQMQVPLIELNFEKEPRLAEIFVTNDVSQILMSLETVTGQRVSKSNSLLFLDEIQSAPALLAKLRWFAEDLPELAVIAAGSLLDFALKEHEFSMPVGRINYMYLQSMSFVEFLLATNRKTQYEYISAWQLGQSIPTIIHDSLSAAVREYILVGGMPEAVKNWCTDHSFISVMQTQQDLIATYRDDFNKYRTRINKQYLDQILYAIPDLLGHKFKYSAVNGDVQSISIKNALDLLVTARLVYKVNCCHTTGLPLQSNINPKFFKTILLDVGLVSALLNLSVHPDLLSNEFSLDNSGGIAEQFVGMELLNVQPFYQDPSLFYWAREEKNSAAEVDYIIQHKANIVPVEVKAGSTGTLRSLHYLMQLRGFATAVRVNGALPSIVDVHGYRLLSLPFYLINQIHRLLG